MSSVKRLVFIMALSVAGLATLSEADIDLAHWVMADVSQVDRDQDWIFASRGPVLMKTDAGDPDSLEELELNHLIVDLVLYDSNAYVLTDGNELLVFDSGRRLEGGAMNILQLEEAWTAMVVDGDRDRLFLAGRSGLGIVDVSDPEALVYLSAIEMGRSVSGVCVDHGRVYAFCGSRFWILEIDDDAVEVGQWVGSISDLEVSGQYAYVCAAGERLRIISLEDPENPESISVLRDRGSYLSLSLAGNLALVTSREADQDLSVIDVSDPEFPAVIGELDWWSSPHEVGSDGSNCVMGGDNSLVSIDLGFPQRPYPIWSVGFQRWISSMTAEGEYAYVNSEQGIQVLDLSDPEEMAFFPVIETSRGFFQVEVEDGLLVGHPWGNELNFFDLQNMDSPVVFPRWFTWWEIWDMALNERRLYLATGWDGLEILDISDPSIPNILGGLVLPTGVRRITLVGHLAAVSGWGLDEPLRFIDVSNPSLPVLRGEINLGAFIGRSASGGGLVFLATGETFHIIDPGDGTDAVILSSKKLNQSIRSLTWVRGQLWCVLYGGGLRVFDLEHPERPRPVAVFDRADLQGGLGVGRDFVAAAAEDGIWIFQDGPLFPVPRRGGGRSGSQSIPGPPRLMGIVMNP